LLSDDVIVVPEFQFAEAIEAFPGSPVVVFVQNPFSLMTSYHKCLKRGIIPQKHVNYWLGIAEVCRSHLEIFGFRPNAIFPVTMKPNDFPYQETKQKLVTYMPRKRPWEAKLIDAALTMRGNIYDYKVEALENMSRIQVAKKLSESRIFISLLHQEALGFPAAEAMASGCIVVGFDGLGTAEYFDNKVGIPVTEGDVAGLINAVESAVQQYEADPTELDKMRKAASERVNENYSQIAFEERLLFTWLSLNKNLNNSF
jgi:glycosyltransferase involved in cell wall biosynthesis